MRLIAQMVAKDEASRYLPEVLTHLKGITDEIVFTDDGSTDNTPELAESFGAHVYRNEESLFGTNEGQLRQGAWNNLHNHAEPGDWILAIDADEKLYATSPSVAIREMMAQPNFDVINIKFFHMWNKNQYRVDKAWKPTDSSRMFRFFLGGKFSERALACGSEPSYVNILIRRRRYLRDSGLIMQHLGYVADEDKQNKYDRYMKLDAGQFHNKAHIESILDDSPRLINWQGTNAE